MNHRKALVWGIVIVGLAAVVFALRGRVHFDWANFVQQLRHASVGHILAGIALIYSTYWLRSMRWAVFVAPTKKIGWFRVLGAQFIGFAAVALFGRLADLTRPYLVARRVELSLSSQIAVYTIERMFDLGAAAIVFSSALAFTPRDMPHHEVFARTGLISLAGTLVLAVFAVFVRVSGGMVASFARATLGRLSEKVGEQVAEKILGFREGLNAIASVREFLVALAISLAMWGIIGEAYVQSVHAFVQTPELAGLTYSRTMLLMAASIGGSLLQLPILGWFTQIAVTAAAMHAFYGAPLEAATACGGVLLLVTFISVIPMGMLFARIDKVSLKNVTRESGEAELAAATESGGGPVR